MIKYGVQCNYVATKIRRAGAATIRGLAWLLVGGATCAADPPDRTNRVAPADKRTCELLLSAPRAALRGMHTDRPDQTESAYTVDAGRFQVEMDLLRLTLDSDRFGGGDVRTETWAVAPLNLKAGLRHDLDLQFVLDPFIHARSEDRAAGTVNEATGFGDLQTRLKLNLWGNDGGRTALAVMPFVKWPLPQSSLRNGRVEGGVIFPFALDLGRGWGLGAMTECDFVAGEDDGDEVEFVNSVTLARDVTRRLGMYVEFYTVTGTAPGLRWQGQVDVGWTYALGEDMQLDLGCNFGVTEAAPDFNPFVGLSRRF